MEDCLKCQISPLVKYIVKTPTNKTTLVVSNPFQSTSVTMN